MGKDKKATRGVPQRKQIEDDMRQELEITLAERSARYLQARPHSIIPNTYFAAASSQCSLLFRDGYFYGCIALVQAVTEAIVRFLCHRNSQRSTKNFKKNVENLSPGNVISEKLKKSLLRIWEKRHDYHHLNPTVETDRRALEGIALDKVRLLVEVEREIFSFTLDEDGKIIPKHPKYWEKTNNQVFLRIRP